MKNKIKNFLKVFFIIGTPGVGKSSVSFFLSKEFIVFNLNEISKKCIIKYDEKFNSHEIDLKKLNKEIDNLIIKNQNKKIIFFEGHLGCELKRKKDTAFVLRCDPLILKKRLKKRNYKNEKIKQNLISEAIDYSVLLAKENFKKIYEINSSTIKQEEIFNLIKNHVLKQKKLDEKLHFDFSNVILDNPYLFS